MSRLRQVMRQVLVDLNTSTPGVISFFYGTFDKKTFYAYFQNKLFLCVCVLFFEGLA